MEDTFRDSVITAIAPVAWGSTYFVTAQFLPPDDALWGGVLRALPIGLLMVAVRRRLPWGAWWWRTALLGSLTIGAFFWLIYVAAVRLPSGLASTLMATSPIVLMLMAWPIVGERPRRLPVIGGIAGFVGVTLLVTRGDEPVDAIGLIASLTAMVIAQLGFVLTKRWGAPVDGLTFAGWQLTAGGLFLVPFALLVEGAPPALTATNAIGFLYLGVVATGLAYFVWLRGLHRLPAGSVGLIGLLNPLAGVALGVLFAHEVLGPLQVIGIALVLAGVLVGQPAITDRLARRPRQRVSAAVVTARAGNSRPTGQSWDG